MCVGGFDALIQNQVAIFSFARRHALGSRCHSKNFLRVQERAECRISQGDDGFVERVEVSGRSIELNYRVRIVSGQRVIDQHREQVSIGRCLR